MANPNPNAPRFNDPPTVPPDGSPESKFRESLMAFADDTLSDGTDGEAPLRAVRIIVRFLDATSGQLRQETIEASLID
jgi:hypothetical protein